MIRDGEWIGNVNESARGMIGAVNRLLAGSGY
jgi:hypothetical protein